MSNNYFRFKQFTIYHDKCAMKVGTDGVLLGAWAEGGKKILDIGTGTGLIALMMAQRFNKSVVDAIEIDPQAAEQAKANVGSSIFNKRINVINASLEAYCNINACSDIKYDSIVCNPPFFNEKTHCPELNRNIARHTESLTYKDLLNYCSKLLKDEGILSVIVPTECENEIRFEAGLNNLFINKVCYIKTSFKKYPKRIMISISKNTNKETIIEEQCLMNSDGCKSEWYENLTKDFYL